MQSSRGCSIPSRGANCVVLRLSGQPLLQRRQEHEKKRKEIKENWIRAKRKLVPSL